jgi:pyruvate/2-oxoglutarate dehydrogenase complex dihydrolipoamide dehydrogenase (E3) component
MGFPGSEHAMTHSDVWAMRRLPTSVVVGTEATGCQLAFVFAAFGSRVRLLDVAPRILGGEGEAVFRGVGRGVRAARDRDPHRHRQGQTPREEMRETTAEGLCKLVVSRSSRLILGAHIVGEQAVEVVQLAAAAMRAGMPVEQLADLELAYPTFTTIVGLAARRIVRDLDPDSPRQRASGRSAAAEWEHSELG